MIGGIKRFFGLWALYARMDLIWMVRDFRNAIFYFFSDTIMNIGAVTSTFLLAERFSGLGRWSRDEVIFMLGYTLVSNGLVYVFFNMNISHISRRIGRGQLDHVLVQPLSLPMAFLTEGFVPVSSLGVWLPGVFVLLWAGGRLSIELSIGWLAVFLLNIVSSTSVILSFLFIWSSIAFYAPRSAEEISTSAEQLLGGLKTFPLDGLPIFLVGALITLAPAGLIGWYPSRALLGIDGAGYAIWLTPAIALALGAVAIAIFRRGLSHYHETGSSRYSAQGHRR